MGPNPVLGNLRYAYGQQVDTRGIVNRAGVLTMILFVAAWFVWQAYPPVQLAAQVAADGTISRGYAMPDGLLPWMMVGTFGGFAVAMFTIFNPGSAPFSAPIYAALEGIALSAWSVTMESRYPGLALQAVTLTFCVFGGMLVLYEVGLIRPSQKLMTFLLSSMTGVILLYVGDAVAQFWNYNLPLVNTTSIWGIGFSLFVVGLAALNLVFDFEAIEEAGERGTDNAGAWYAAFGLMVTLVWLYLEIARLLLKAKSKD